MFGPNRLSKGPFLCIRLGFVRVSWQVACAGSGSYGIAAANYGGPIKLFETYPGSNTRLRDMAPQSGIVGTTGGRGAPALPFAVRAVHVLSVASMQPSLRATSPVRQRWISFSITRTGLTFFSETGAMVISKTWPMLAGSQMLLRMAEVV